MGAWGAIIMSFFGALFAAMTLALQYEWSGMWLGLPFVAFAAIAWAAILIIRLPGAGVSPSKRAGNVILWSSLAEGVGLFIAANLVAYLGHPEMLLPAMALVVGSHFLPMAHVIPFPPFYGIGISLLAAAAISFGIAQPLGAEIAGFAAAIALLAAAILALRRDLRAKRT